MLLLLPSEHVQEGLRRQRQWQAAGEKEILHLLQLAHHHPSGQHGPQSLLVMAHTQHRSPLWECKKGKHLQQRSSSGMWQKKKTMSCCQQKLRRRRQKGMLHQRGLHSRERGMGAKREYNLLQQQKKRMHQPKSCSEGRVCA